ncbi:MFS transporter [Amycolatopsis sp. SID8362]|uniref:MFS transporter n=1 Tax=Amycolatopsis sp. SID8362 TaxID=2690346 RepID=UPI00136CC3E0|nr:MFS transporter [Amycolatopsis sp. SID8362]NBH10073.1 MFS transporter [Amycolatopsis sp. SID8362]NED46767.1 MFS transporter [Amycolatopsis sp. SID8362]
MDKPAGRREWLGLAVLVLPTLLVAMDMTSLFLALPQLSAELGASATEQLWITDSYGFVVAGFVITMGTLGDRIGRRRLLLAGGAAFGILSIVAAFSTSPEMLIVVRGALGVAGATLMPSTLALITNMFRDGRQRGKAISIWATCQFAGGAAGPVFAGFLLQHFPWGSVFLVAVPAVAVLLAAGPFLLPEFRAPASGRLDLPGVALSLAAVLLIVFGLKQLTTGELLVPLGAIALGALLGAVFAHRQLTTAFPLLDLRLFRNRPFAAVLVSLVFAGVAMAGVGLLVTQYLQSVLGYSPLLSAVLFAPMGLGVALGTMTAPTLTRWLSPATAIAGGLLVSAAGSLLLVFTHGPALVMAGIAILTLGTGPLFALGIGLVMGSVPPERAGSAASMADTGNYLGGSLGLALIGLTATAVYHGVFPAGSTLAVDVTRPELAAQAKEAFTTALNVTGVIAAALFLGLALLVRTMSRTGAAVAPQPTMAG